MPWNKSLANTAIYFGSNLLEKAIPFLLLPLMTAYLNPAEYGYMAIFNTLVVLLTPLIGMHMYSNISASWYKTNEHPINEVITALTILITISSSIGFIFFWVWQYTKISILNIPPNILLWIPAIIFGSTLTQFYLTSLRLSEKALQYGTIQILLTIMNVGLSITFVIFLHMNWQGRALAMLISAVILGVLSLLFIIKDRLITNKVSVEVIRDNLQFCIPLIPHAFGGIIILASDRIFIDKMLGKDAVGIYSVAYSFGLIMRMGSDAINKVWSPWLLKTLSQKNNSNEYQIIVAVYKQFILMLITGLAVGLLAYPIIPIMTTPAFHSASHLVLWIALGHSFEGMYRIIFGFILHNKKTRFLAKNTFMAAIINIILTFILIRFMGLIGAAIATTLAYLYMFISIWIFVNKIHPMPWFKFKELLHNAK